MKSVRNDRLRFGTLCVLVYVFVSWSVRFDMRLGEDIASLVYPFDTFSMYGGMPGKDSTALLIRDGDGTVHRVTAFRAFSCAEPLPDASKTVPACPRAIPYLHDDIVHYIESHRGPGRREVELIARSWEIRSGAPPVQAPDCVVAHCKVSP
jgi:hypothetical protein